MSLERLRENQYNRLLDARNLNNLIQTHGFEWAYESSTSDERKRIEELCNGSAGVDSTMRRICYDALRRFIREKNEINTDIRTLRARARELGIRQYSRLPKSDLILEIHRYGTKNGIRQKDINHNDQNQNTTT